MALGDWKSLLKACSRRRREPYPIPAYSEFMPPVHLGCRPYEGRPDDLFSEEDPAGWPITEFEEHIELRPGLESIAHQVIGALIHLVRREPAERLSKSKLIDNPYWPPELAQKAEALMTQERFVLILPLALSRTQDDKGRVHWTLMGGSEQGPARPFWKSFLSSPGREIPSEKALGFIRVLLGQAYGEPSEKGADLHRAGFRIFRDDGRFPQTDQPAWAEDFTWTQGMPLRGVRYLLTFEPFGNLPEKVKDAYLAGNLQLLPFPGSLLFWGVPGYLSMRQEYAFSNQIPLLHLIERHEAPHGLRVPQSGWVHIPHPDHPFPHRDVGPFMNTFRRTHRWARVHRHEDELAVPGREDHIAHVLFSTAPKDLDLYGKPMARNSQIWTEDHHLLLDGPNATRTEIRNAFESIEQGGLFGYRFQYPPMEAGSHQVYWHRPLVAYLSQDARPEVLPDILSGYLTAYDKKRPDLDRPIEIWPLFLQRDGHLAAVELFKDKKHEHKTMTRALNLLEAQKLLGKGKLPRSFARQVLMLSEKRTIDEWLGSLPEVSGNPERGQWLATQLQRLIVARERALVGPKGMKFPESLTFLNTARRSFEMQYWRNIAYLSAGKYLNKANSDCVQDPETQRMLKHHHRDLDGLGDYLLRYYRRVIAGRGMQGRALVGDLPFRWETDFDFKWWGGWLKNQEGRPEERNLMVMIPGRDRRRAVIMADHYDTAYMEDVYYKDKGGSGARLAAAGADDNYSATAALMQAAPIFCEMSRKGELAFDVWLIHLTGEEFPSDCLGARHLCQSLIEGTLTLRLPGGQAYDLSKVRIQGAFVLDMVAHNNENDPDKFQISPGVGRESCRLAYHAHIANEIWNASIPIWNRRPSRRSCKRGKRSWDKNIVPETALHPRLDGQVRLPRDPRSSLYNTDGQIFSDTGVPIVLFMENYDINRKGYHDSHDTMANIDLDYGAAVTAIAIETVARVATGKPVKM